MGAIYKGLAIASTAAGDQLYATDFHNARVDVFDSSFNLVSTPGAFVDEKIPRRYAPHGIQNINGAIFVTYARQDKAKVNDVPGAGHGFVDMFDTSGNLMARVASKGALERALGIGARAVRLRRLQWRSAGGQLRQRDDPRLSAAVERPLEAPRSAEGLERQAAQDRRAVGPVVRQRRPGRTDEHPLLHGRSRARVARALRKHRARRGGSDDDHDHARRRHHDADDDATLPVARHTPSWSATAGRWCSRPRDLTINVGDTVRWVWMSSGHSVVSGTDGNADNQFCSPSNTGCDNPPLSSKGFTFEHTFTQAGYVPVLLLGPLLARHDRHHHGAVAPRRRRTIVMLRINLRIMCLAGRPLRCALCEDDRCGECTSGDEQPIIGERLVAERASPAAADGTPLRALERPDDHARGR